MRELRFVLSFARSMLPDMRRPGTALFYLYWGLLALLIFTVPVFAQEAQSCYLPEMSVEEFRNLVGASLAFLAVCWLVKTLGGLLRAV